MTCFHTRRALLPLLAAAAAAPLPAAAQVSFGLPGLGNLKRMAQAASFDEPDEIRMGESLYGRCLDLMGGAYRNRAVQAAVRRLAEPIFATSARPALKWEITVVDDNEVNAWSLPGGKLGINKGLVRYAASEDELCAVIAHEMGHAELSHAARELRKKALNAGLATAASAATAASSDGDRRLAAAGFASLELAVLTLAAQGYARADEHEADRHIARVFARTGHGLDGAVRVYGALLRLAPAKTRGRTSLFAGHPETRARIADLSRLTSSAPALRPQSADFAALKAVFPTRKA